MSLDYTPEQHAAVKRVLLLKETDYYTILLVEKKCSPAEVKKAYRKLALVMHPDKNGAPKADEAFKRVNDAFQVLSDETQRRIYDQTGSDPRSRARAPPQPGFGGGFNSPFGHSGFARQQFAGDPQDIFTQFFGGPTFGQTQFQFNFGGDGEDIFSSLFGMPPQQRQRTRQRNAPPNPKEARDQTVFALVLIAIVFILPTVLSWILGSSETSLPSFRFDSQKPYTEERFTPNHKVPFFTNPKDTNGLSPAKERTLGKRVETQFVSATQSQCRHEYLARQQALTDAIGWFFTDEAAYQAAKEMDLPSCDLLDQMGVRLRY